MASTSVAKSSLNTFAKFDNTSAGNTTSQFIVTGGGGVILTSPDAITWTSRTSSIPAGPVVAPHRNRNLYAVFDNSYNRWISSDNGVTWAKNGSAAGNFFSSTASYQNNAKPDPIDGTVNLFPNMFGLSGNTGSMFDVTNANAISDNTVTGSNCGFWDYATNGSVYLYGVSVSGTSPYLLRSTTKGGPLTSISYGSSTPVYTVAWGASKFALADSNGTGVWTSTDGLTWTSRGQSFRYLTFQNNLFLGYQGNTLATSSDAITWTARTVTGLGGNSIYKIVFGAGVYVIISDGGLIFTSPDGITWTSRTSGTAQNLRGLYYG
jgi:hypothetical protein